MKLYLQEKEIISHYESKEGEIIAELLANINKDKKQYEIYFSGRPIINRTMLVSSFFEEGDTVILRELQQQQQPSLQQQQQQQQQKTHYYPITKYIFYDLDDMNVRIIVELKDIEKVPLENFQARFFERSFEIKIHNYLDKDWAFGIGRTQCSINIEGSKFITKKGKLLITLRKVKKEDNWFSIYKQRTIGGDDSD